MENVSSVAKHIIAKVDKENDLQFLWGNIDRKCTFLAAIAALYLAMSVGWSVARSVVTSFKECKML